MKETGWRDLKKKERGWGGEGRKKAVHSCMPSPIAPDPIRVQPCVYSEPIGIVWR